MTKEQWNYFENFRNEFKKQCKYWERYSSLLEPLQKQSSLIDTPDYPIENPIVYNTGLDKLTSADDIKLIVIGDNPGKNEQLSKNCRYLCGQAGKLAEGFFKRNPECNIDFRKNVIILNKTPVHTAKTIHLRTLLQSGNKEVGDLIEESQIWMAKKTAELHQALSGNAQLWLTGYSELRGNGLFWPYRNAFLSSYKDAPDAWKKVKVFQHFSMNRFSIDLKDFQSKNENSSGTANSLDMLGDKHKEEIFISSVMK